jgi:hypothetical protein
MTKRHTPSSNDCLGRTCLKWQSNGELSDLDLSLVLARLQEAETMAAASRQRYTVEDAPPNA